MKESDNTPEQVGNNRFTAIDRFDGILEATRREYDSSSHAILAEYIDKVDQISHEYLEAEHIARAEYHLATERRRAKALREIKAAYETRIVCLLEESLRSQRKILGKYLKDQYGIEIEQVRQS